MRIISGSLKGRQLLKFQASHIRPTTDRVKESIFNRLMGEVEGARVLDLFSGTGNLSIEAFSRGASEVLAVELSSKSLQILRKNLKYLKIPSDKIKVLQRDVLKYLRLYEEPPFQIIFIDPPFTQKMAHKVMEALSQSSVYNEETSIVIESSSQERIEDAYGELKLSSRAHFGDKVVSFYRL